ncbi:MAG: peptidoglycan-binding protein [bacterium]
MKYKIIVLLSLLAVAFSFCFVYAKVNKDTDKDGLSDHEEQIVYKTDTNKSDTDADGFRDGEEVFNGFSPTQADRAKLNQVKLDVPYISEAPDGNWTGPWKNACEESSMAMVEYYYLGRTTVQKQTAKDFMWGLFVKQDQLYGSNADADSVRINHLINNYGSFSGQIIDNPTIDQIKKELQQKRPVISLHHGFDLNNKNIPFLANGSSYHVMVIIGYDDINKEFITNDPGDTKQGPDHIYKYDLFMKTLHDFDFKTGKANSTARVIFTYPKLAQSQSNGRIYHIDIVENTKHYISNPGVFKQKGWNWDMIMVVEDQWLDQFQAGENYDHADNSTKQESGVEKPEAKIQSSKYQFTKNLNIGSSGGEVKQLQIKLKELGYYSYSQITGYFGHITESAVVKFQRAKNLQPYPGVVGPKTRQELNKL